MAQSIQKKISNPSFHETLHVDDINHLHAYRIDNVLFENQECEDIHVQEEFYECKFENVTIHEQMKSCLFVDVIFEHCDLSNADFNECVFRRCTFNNCRMTGIDLTNTSCTDVQLNHCQCTLLNVSASKWNKAIWNHCIFVDGAFNMMKLKDVFVDTCNFSGCEIQDTSLSDIDLSTSNIENIMIVPECLKGVIVNQDQAIALAQLLGIRVKN